MENIRFKVTVNPFEMTAKVLAMISENEKDNQEIEFTFKDFDWWDGFKVNGKEFDIHIHYDEEFTTSIYAYENGVGNYDNCLEVELYLQLNSGLISEVKTVKLY